MVRIVSVSPTGQNQPPPSRRERDDAESFDCGRKAVEKTIEDVIEEGKAKDKAKTEKLVAAVHEPRITAHELTDD